MENANVNPMQCNPITGLCEMPSSSINGQLEQITLESTKQRGSIQEKPIKLLYFTDPICSSCWGIEPQLRKLKAEYGNYLNIEYRMGGLLKSWDSYGGKDVNGPASVAAHWDDASKYYNMPIDGSLWLEDPLYSSYPPSIAFKAAQMQDLAKAQSFLRRIKEMVFIEKKNIAKWNFIKQAAMDVDLELGQFEIDYNGEAKDLFADDLAKAKEWGVRGFPTIYFLDKEQNQLNVYGSKPYEVYEQTLLKLLHGIIVKNLPSSPLHIFQQFPSVALQEYALYYSLDLSKAMAELERMESNQQIRKYSSRAGIIWYKNEKEIE